MVALNFPAVPVYSFKIKLYEYMELGSLTTGHEVFSINKAKFRYRLQNNQCIVNPKTLFSV